jgi:transposase
MTLEQQAASLSQQEIVRLLVRNAELEQQVAWFRKQIFGERSEKRAYEADPRQLTLGENFTASELPASTETVKSYSRRKSELKEEPSDETGLRFSDNIPVQEIHIPNPEIEGLEEGKDYKVISEKVTHRLAQRRAPYVVLRYIRKVVKLNDKVLCPAAPPAVIEKSYADVSFFAGLLVDKFVYHLPLYRQHQRLQSAGIELSRQTLTNLVHRAVSLLEPIYYALLSSILLSRVLAMDETPTKAGRSGKGKMHQGYFWPVYGDKDEVAFCYSRSRAAKTIMQILGSHAGVLLTDGYEAYERYAKQVSTVVHAQCWAHARRNFVEAEDAEPQLCRAALRLISELYSIEAQIKDLSEEKRQQIRGEQSRDLIYRIFSELEQAMKQQVLLPSNPFHKAASYVLSRKEQLSVFLSDPDVPIDTNHLEREIRPIPLGRKNWLFCWSECGAEAVGKIQSLIATCKLHGIDPYTYLVDVLQRIDSHPVMQVDLLTPRLWKEHFAAAPLKGDLI